MLYNPCVMFLNFLFSSVLSLFLRGNMKDKEFSKEGRSRNSQRCKLVSQHIHDEKAQVNLPITIQLI